jgi:flagellar hook assembly protein FlgD
VVIDTVVSNAGQLGNDLEWKWSGHNKQGRTVGTGTYVFKASCVVKGAGSNGADVRDVIQRMVGFVRGKN